MAGRYQTKEDILRSLNRIKSPPSIYMEKGSALEHCVMERVATYKGHTFKEPLITELADALLPNGTWQVKLEAEFPLGDKNILLYGFADYIAQNTCYDIKGTNRYSGVKFADSYQHHVYLYCANRMGISVTEMQYVITNYATTFKEVYDYDHEQTVENLKHICSELIRFAEQNRKQIFDPKFFANDTPKPERQS